MLSNIYNALPSFKMGKKKDILEKLKSQISTNQTLKWSV